MSERVHVDTEVVRRGDDVEVRFYARENRFHDHAVVLNTAEYRAARRDWTNWVEREIRDVFGAESEVARRKPNRRAQAALLVAGLILGGTAVRLLLPPSPEGGIAVERPLHDSFATEARRAEELRQFTRPEVVAWFSGRPRGATSNQLSILFDLARQYEVREAIPRALARAAHDVPYEDPRYPSVVAARYLLTKFDDSEIQEAAESTPYEASLRDFMRWRKKNQ